MKKGSIDPIISILMAATIAVSAFSFSANYSSADAFITDDSSETMTVVDEEAARQSFDNFFGITRENEETAASEDIAVETIEESEETAEATTEAVAQTEAIETQAEDIIEDTEEAVEEEAEETAQTAASTEETAAETLAETEAAAEAIVEETAAQDEPEISETEATVEQTFEATEQTEAVVETTVEETSPSVVEETVIEETVETTAAPAPVVVYPPAGTVEYEVLVLVNNARAAEGLAPLSWSDGLAGAAAVRASEIAVVFDHTRPDGSSCYTVSDLIWAENIACGQTTAAEVFNCWMNSPGHRANIMAPDYTTMGLALNANGDGVYNYYWAQEFGY